MFCENSLCPNLKTNNVKYIKVYIFRKEILQWVVVRFLAKNCIFEKSPKIDFSAQKFLNKGQKNIFWINAFPGVVNCNDNVTGGGDGGGGD